jgi:hypothetical protein
MKYTILDLPYGIRVDIENDDITRTVMIKHDELAKDPVGQLETLLDSANFEDVPVTCVDCGDTIKKPRCRICQ